MYPAMKRRVKGFTLVELLTVIAIISILTAILIPAVGKAKAKVVSVQCRNHLKQLQICWQLYVTDQDDRVPPNRSEQVNGIWRSSRDSWIGLNSALYDDTYATIEGGILFRYDYNRTVGIYHCPADKSKVRAQSGREASGLRTRSYSMNGFFGGNEDTNKPPTTIQKAGQVRRPSELFVFIEEHEDSIDDAHFLVWAEPDTRWVNLPSGRHQSSGNLSFVDGHVENWRWKAPKVFAPKTDYWKEASDPLDLEDLRRLQSHARQEL